MQTRIFFSTMNMLGLSVIISLASTTISPLNTIGHSYALQQVAGNPIIETMPGETETFSWGVISDRNASITINITADGLGAEYLSFPENVTLPAGKNVTYIPVKVSIPADYSGDEELTPTVTATEAGNVTATEAGEEVGTTIINIGVSKILCIVVGAQNNATTMATIPTVASNQQQPAQNTTGLELKDYTQEVVLSNNATGNQSIINIPIKSTSENITEFSFNQTRNELSFRAIGDAGTNGTTIIYVDQILQEPYSLVVDRIPSNVSNINTNSTTGERSIQITYPHHCIDNDVILRGSEGTTTTTRENIT